MLLLSHVPCFVSASRLLLLSDVSCFVSAFFAALALSCALLRVVAHRISAALESLMCLALSLSITLLLLSHVP